MRVLVTGGRGFLGKAVCARLIERGHEVTSLARGDCAGLTAIGVRQLVGDVRDRTTVAEAVHGQAAVVHCAAKAGAWGSAREYHEINVGGTANVVAHCVALGVRRLVLTSSPSVVHNGDDLDGVDESAPYATRFLAPYPYTKCLAERLVLAANSPRLATVALRPHLIWGPGDPHFTPRLLARARSGRLRHIGRTSKLIDTVYVDNAADAHVLAVERLTPGSPLAGRAYSITQGEPAPADVVINALLAAAGLPSEHRRIPRPVARALGFLCETAFRAARSHREPPLTRFLVEQLSTAHWFDISAARRDLEYEPRVSAVDGLANVARYLTGANFDGTA